MEPMKPSREVMKGRRRKPVKPFRLFVPSNIMQEQRDQFTSHLAHEVRNPLTTITLLAQMLKSMTVDEQQISYLDIILGSSRRINELVTNLRLSSQTDEQLPGNHSIHRLLDEVLEITRGRIVSKNITIRRDYAAVGCEIMMNREEMKLALTNIILHAIDAMSPGKGRLRLFTRSTNGQCVIEIEDNGAGIGQEKLNRLFTPHVIDKPGGKDLGLSTTLNILLSNHVMAEVQSEEGKGTSFILSFDAVSEPSTK
jgi:signal transduction histidine kinase